MHIGVCKVLIRIPENQNLKGKRRILKSLTDRLQNQFNISLAEVENQDTWQLATLGIACVNSDAKHLQQTFSKMIAFIEQSAGEFELLDIHQEIISGL